MVVDLHKIMKHTFLITFFISAQAFGTPKTYYVANDGIDINTGLSIDLPLATIPMAVTKAVAGDTIYIRGGIHSYTAKMSISKSGSASARYYLLAYSGERPILDFQAAAANSSYRGIQLSGSYWYIKGLDLYRAGDNGMYISGSNNIIEFCAFYENYDTGLQLGSGASNNQVINCDSYYNCDLGQGNADGFAPKLDVGTGNYFYGCRAWQNSDDGWDGYIRPAAPVAGKDTMKTIIENCWCFSNGYLKSGMAGSGNGNGFKMGGGDKDNTNTISNVDSLRHNMTLINCLSFNNLVKGFDQNNNRGTMTLINCTGYANGSYNYAVPGFIRVGEILTVKNCLSLASSGVSLAGVPDPVLATNSWSVPFTTPADSDFISIDTTGVRGSRKADGSLPDITFMHLKMGSQFINGGTDVGLTFHGTEPDLGCFESDYPTSVAYINELKISGFQLFQNYPNPFNPATVIRFSVGKPGNAKLKVINILGQEIAVLYSGKVEPGKLISISFNASALPSGIYFSILECGVDMQTQKMVLMK